MGKALWRRAFDAVENAVGPRTEEWVRQAPFATAVVVAQRTSVALSGFVEAESRKAWHRLNLPAGTDVRRLRRQVGDLDREVRLLRETLERSARPEPVVPPAAAGARRTRG